MKPFQTADRTLITLPVLDDPGGPGLMIQLSDKSKTLTFVEVAALRNYLTAWLNENRHVAKGHI